MTTTLRTFGWPLFCLFILGCSRHHPPPLGLGVRSSTELSRPDHTRGPRPRQIIQSAHVLGVTALSVSPDEKLVASSGEDHSIRVWYLPTRKLLAIHRYEGSAIQRLAWTSTASLVGIAKSGGRFILRLGAQIRQIAKLPSGAAEPVALAGQGAWVVASRGEAVQVVDEHQRVVQSISCDPLRSCRPVTTEDARHLVVETDEGERHGFEVTDEGRLAPWNPPPLDRNKILSPTGAFSLTVVDSGVKRGWFEDFRRRGPVRYAVHRRGRQQPIAEIKVPGGDIRAVKVSSDGRFVAAAYRDSGTIRVVDVASGRELWERPGYAPITFSAASNLLLSSNGDGTFSTHDLDTGVRRSDFGASLVRGSDVLVLGPHSIAVLGQRTATTWSIDAARLGHSMLLREDVSSGYHRVSPRGTLFVFNKDGGRANCKKDNPIPVVVTTFAEPPGAEDVREAENVFGKKRWPDQAEGLRVRACAPAPHPYIQDFAGDSLLINHRFDLLVSRISTQNVIQIPENDGFLQHIGPALSPDGELVAALAIANGNRARLWQIDPLRLVVDHPLPGGAFGQDEWTPYMATFSANGQAVAFRAARRILVFKTENGVLLRTLEAPAEVTAIAFGRGPGELFAADATGSLHVFSGGQRVGGDPSDGGTIRALRYENSSRFLATLSEDGAARIWDAATGRLRASMAAFDDEEWVIATPAGAYTGTGEVGERVGWAFMEPPEHFGFEQFADFRNDALVRARLTGTATTDAAIAIRRPPRIAIEHVDVERSGDRARVTVHASSDHRVDQIRLFSEGRQVGDALLELASGKVGFEVPLVRGNNRLSAIATDAHGFSSNPAIADVVSRRSRRPPKDLWVVAIGISHYPKLFDDVEWPTAKKRAALQQMQLPAAKNDALSLASALRALAGPGRTFAAAHVQTLVDEEATPAAIRSALETLSEMSPNDVAVVSFAGHGFKPGAGSDMVFATSKSRLRPDGSALARVSVNADTVGWPVLSAALASAKGAVVVLLDACHSGHVSQELIVANDELASRLARERRTGVVVFAAAKGRQSSFEPGVARARGIVRKGTRHLVRFDEDRPNGFFTGAVIESLGARRTDRNGDGAIQLSELIEEVTERVSTATGGLQTPWVARRAMFGDFTLVQLASPD